MSKLAALAAARKKKESEKNKASADSSAAQESVSVSPSETQRNTSISLLDRLGGNGKARAGLETRTLKFPLRKAARAPASPPEEKPRKGLDKPKEPSQKPEPSAPEPPASVPKEQPHPSAEELLAQPSSFATVLTGNQSSRGPPCCFSNCFDMFKIYRRDLTDLFDFAEPSPDDVVLNAQNTAKGQFRFPRGPRSQC